MYTERGPHGGVHLHEDYRVQLTDLNETELAALFALGVPAPLSDLGMGAGARGALLKLAAALPQARRGVDRNVRSRLYLDPNPWHATHESIPTLSALRQAAWEDRWVRVTLLRVRQIPIEHEMAPYGLVAKGRIWYVIWRRRDEQLRVDRASDVIRAEVTQERFVRSSDFDLAEFWTNWASAHETMQWPYHVRLRVAGDTWRVIERDLARHVEQSADAHPERSWIDVQLAFDTLEHARGVLLGLGSAVEVMEPDALRLSMADFAEQILATYRG